ncbi:putative phosphatase [uncultured Sporomusa sp.]|uniref:Putative phosphatase n=1 Tax=uncultured Sporomusa sp. TaxID=307249 RepID=A0A212LUC1_9FIRM|nr:HAD family hydrolase [uncultured Sporomusa sp.]SCM81107.1 putative phosphatase [uncultured Sporomusa sp.]
MQILFWDIDGTLIRTAKAGLYAFCLATEELWGKPVDIAAIKAAGMTDNYIARQIIRSVSGREANSEEIARLCCRYEALLQEQLENRKGLILPEVKAILSRLQGQTEYKMLLLTGNSRQGAEIKLKHFGLDHYFDFHRSAFAGQCELRVDIARSGLEMVRSTWGDPRQHTIYVIGDTPHDVECGKAIGAYTIAIATGGYSAAELANCTPWWVVETLPPAEAFLEKITAARP